MDKTCRQCGETKGTGRFYLVKNRHGRSYTRNECIPCTHENNKLRKRTPRFTDDVTYDYKFAVSLWGWEHDKALSWLEKGYPGVTRHQMDRMDLRQYAGTGWSPDAQ